MKSVFRIALGILTAVIGWAITNNSIISLLCGAFGWGVACCTTDNSEWDGLE